MICRRNSCPAYCHSVIEERLSSFPKAGNNACKLQMHLWGCRQNDRPRSTTPVYYAGVLVSCKTYDYPYVQNRSRPAAEQQRNNNGIFPGSCRHCMILVSVGEERALSEQKGSVQHQEQRKTT